MRTLLLIPILLLLTACGGPRKACRKAERLVTKATILCPVLLQRDTLVVELPGDTVYVPPAPYATADLDSLQAACQQLSEALAAERDLYALALAHRPATQQAVANLRRAACQYPPFTFEHELFTLTLAGGNTPGAQVYVKPRKASVPCPPTVGPQQRHGVAQWYRTGFWVLVAFWLLVAISAYILSQAWRST